MLQSTLWPQLAKHRGSFISWYFNVKTSYIVDNGDGVNNDDVTVFQPYYQFIAHIPHFPNMTKNHIVHIYSRIPILSCFIFECKTLWPFFPRGKKTVSGILIFRPIEFMLSLSFRSYLSFQTKAKSSSESQYHLMFTIFLISFNE